MKRFILKGLQVGEFIHPDELKNKERALNNSAVKKLLDSAANFCKALIDPFTQGTFVQLNDTCAPDLMKIVRDVCKILEVEVPEVYVCHLMDINIMPMGTDNKSYLVVPDYALNIFDEEMLYYNVGNAITMIKADHVSLTTLAAYMPGGGLIEVPKLLFMAYLHAADSTSDRGGLLASQSFAATARCHLFDMGIPPRESRKFFSNDMEAEIFVEKYLRRHKEILEKHNELITKVARKFQRMSYIEAPANKMLRELFDWYKEPNGYRAIISRHGCEYI